MVSKFIFHTNQLLTTCFQKFPIPNFLINDNFLFTGFAKIQNSGLGIRETIHEVSSYLAIKISFFVQFTKTQLITFLNFNIQTCFSQFLWGFSLKCWFKGQIISRIHLGLPNIMEIGMLSFWNVIICLCNGTWNSL